jgi:hypothetical protein
MAKGNQFYLRWVEQDELIVILGILRKCRQEIPSSLHSYRRLKSKQKKTNAKGERVEDSSLNLQETR